MVSCLSDKKSENLGKFKVKEDEFEIYLSSFSKCPRCWKFNSSSEDKLCARCDEVVNK